MSEKDKGAGGTDQNQASGQSGGENEKKDVVAYETHRKLLSEKKARDEENAALKAKLEKYEADQKAAEENSLKEQQKWKELAELKEKELKKANEVLTQVEQEKERAKKLDAFLNALGDKVDPKYWWLIDTDKIMLNPTDKTVEQMSVTTLVDDFKKTYPEVIRKGQGTQTSADAPKDNSSPITYEAWLKMPLKEKKANYKNVIKT